MIGDFNRAIGNGPFGVEGNHPKVSYGGSLVQKFIESGEYILVNNSEKCVGGPFTRVDPHDPKNIEKMSCLDLIIVSKSLFPFIDKMIIDKERKYTPYSTKKSEITFEKMVPHNKSTHG